jgi:hypothetical protein
MAQRSVKFRVVQGEARNTLADPLNDSIIRRSYLREMGRALIASKILDDMYNRGEMVHGNHEAIVERLSRNIPKLKQKLRETGFGSIEMIRDEAIKFNSENQYMIEYSAIALAIIASDYVVFGVDAVKESMFHLLSNPDKCPAVLESLGFSKEEQSQIKAMGEEEFNGKLEGILTAKHLIATLVVSNTGC